MIRSQFAWRNSNLYPSIYIAVTSGRPPVTRHDCRSTFPLRKGSMGQLSEMPDKSCIDLENRTHTNVAALNRAKTQLARICAHGSGCHIQ
jgi:hypothetical protein